MKNLMNPGLISNNMKTIRILILEDDLKTLAVIMDELFRLEESL